MGDDHVSPYVFIDYQYCYSLILSDIVISRNKWERFKSPIFFRTEGGGGGGRGLQPSPMAPASGSYANEKVPYENTFSLLPSALLVVCSLFLLI